LPFGFSMIDSSAHVLGRWERRTSDFLASQGWSPAASTLLLAVSGGADSVALLHWARRASAASGGRIAVAHINHNLRPSSGGDQAFVADLCRRFGIPCFERALDPAARPARESVEMWARRERYAFFEAAAGRSGADWVLTAHHRDDLVETFFQRLGRGTGPRGLKGIPFRRGKVVRPFLDRSRAEILEYLRLCDASWREDESNLDVRIDRNWYRHAYLPGLRDRDPDLDARVFAMAMRMQSMGAGIDAIEDGADLLRIDPEGRPCLPRGAVEERVASGDAESLAYWIGKLLRSGAEKDGGRPSPVTKAILREFLRQWRRGPHGLQVPLGAGAALKCGNTGIYCGELSRNASKRRRPAKKDCSPNAQRVILIEGFGEVSWHWGDRAYSLSARRFPRPERLEYPARGEGRAIFDANLISCTLLVRTRKDGDRFSPLGVKSRSRKLKAFFNEEKVPVGKRDALPIVLVCEAQNSAAQAAPNPGSDAADGESIAWVPGHGISDFFKVSGSTSHILELVLKCENP
jgi:tRNA(Ile)-lysidine synthetase-like protein